MRLDKWHSEPALNTQKFRARTAPFRAHHRAAACAPPAAPLHAAAAAHRDLAGKISRSLSRAGERISRAVVPAEEGREEQRRRERERAVTKRMEEEFGGGRSSLFISFTSRGCTGTPLRCPGTASSESVAPGLPAPDRRLATARPARRADLLGGGLVGGLMGKALGGMVRGVSAQFQDMQQATAKVQVRRSAQGWGLGLASSADARAAGPLLPSRSAGPAVCLVGLARRRAPLH